MRERGKEKKEKKETRKVYSGPLRISSFHFSFMDDLEEEEEEESLDALRADPT